MTVIARRTEELTEAQRARIFEINDEAHMADHGHHVTEDDFRHAEGGLHFFIEEDGVVVSHGSVVPRALEADGRALHTGYVEAVATVPSHWRRGLASAVMVAATAHIEAEYELGALSTGAQPFYERFGWVTWRGATFVRAYDELRRTADEDGGVMVLVTARTPAVVHLAMPLSCEWREGDVW